MKRGRPHNIAVLRQQLGFSQQHLADFLGVNRVQVALVENNIKDFPGRVIPHLIELQIYLNSHPPQPGLVHPFVKKSEAKQKVKQAQQRLEKYQYQLVVSRRQLTIMQKRYAEALQAYQNLGQLLQADKPRFIKMHPLFKVCRLAMQKKLMRNDPIDQEQLIAKIELVESAIALETKLIAAFELFIPPDL